jgi:hypothetical protein
MSQRQQNKAGQREGRGFRKYISTWLALFHTYFKEQWKPYVFTKIYWTSWFQQPKVIQRSYISLTNQCTLIILYYTIHITIKVVRHVSNPYFGIIIRDLDCELHKLQSTIMIHFIYYNISPTCFESLFWDHQQGLGLWIT